MTLQRVRFSEPGSDMFTAVYFCSGKRLHRRDGGKPTPALYQTRHDSLWRS